MGFEEEINLNIFSKLEGSSLRSKEENKLGHCEKLDVVQL